MRLARGRLNHPGPEVILEGTHLPMIVPTIRTKLEQNAVAEALGSQSHLQLIEANRRGATSQHQYCVYPSSPVPNLHVPPILP